MRILGCRELKPWCWGFDLGEIYELGGGEIVDARRQVAVQMKRKYCMQGSEECGNSDEV